jgi:hypothetical protein
MALSPIRQQTILTNEVIAHMAARGVIPPYPVAVNPTNISYRSISDDAQWQEPLAPLLGLLSREYTSDTDLSHRLGDLFHASAPPQFHTRTSPGVCRLSCYRSTACATIPNDPDRPCILSPRLPTLT